MLLTSVVLISQEILEASLIISVLMVFSRICLISGRWIYPALCLGLMGALWYSLELDRVSEWFDYVGQEIVNASLQGAIYLLVVCFVLLLATRARRASDVLMAACMALIVALAVIREGSEIIIYLSGFLSNSELLFPVLVGSAIGAGIGLSVGALLFYALIQLGSRWRQNTCLVLLALMGSNMLSQASRGLMQADWLPSGQALWDSSALLSERSVVGHVAYALVGYEATPSAVQVAFYMGGFVLVVGIMFFAGLGRQPSEGMPDQYSG